MDRYHHLRTHRPRNGSDFVSGCSSVDVAIDVDVATAATAAAAERDARLATSSKIGALLASCIENQGSSSSSSSSSISISPYEVGGPAVAETRHNLQRQKQRQKQRQRQRHPSTPEMTIGTPSTFHQRDDSSRRFVPVVSPISIKPNPCRQVLGDDDDDDDDDNNDDDDDDDDDHHRPRRLDFDTTEMDAGSSCATPKRTADDAMESDDAFSYLEVMKSFLPEDNDDDDDDDNDSNNDSNKLPEDLKTEINAIIDEVLNHTTTIDEHMLKDRHLDRAGFDDIVANSICVSMNSNHTANATATTTATNNNNNSSNYTTNLLDSMEQRVPYDCAVHREESQSNNNNNNNNKTKNQNNNNNNNNNKKKTNCSIDKRIRDDRVTPEMGVPRAVKKLRRLTPTPRRRIQKTPKITDSNNGGPKRMAKAAPPPAAAPPRRSRSGTAPSSNGTKIEYDRSTALKSSNHPAAIQQQQQQQQQQHSAKETTTGREIFTYKTWDGISNQWRPAITYTTPTHEEDICRPYRIPLSRGGEVNVFPGLIRPACVNRIKTELLESKLWRKYSIQGGDEPRLHFLAHDDATDDFDNEKQPGYRYANITMKARPLSAVPKLQKLSGQLAKLRNIPDGKWNIGVHPVLYRDNRDSMGDHADDDQGETRILCILLDSPPTPRKVIINVFDRLTGGKANKNRVYQNGDEMIELRLRPGDAYEMDGIMQQFYCHRVPKDHDYKNPTPEQIRRICVVLRTGQQKYFERDTGEACADLSPSKRIVYRSGCIPGLKEGFSYSRRELRKMNAHQLLQRGISGCKGSGADAIIISGKRNGDDDLDNLRYVAEWRIGANALAKSFLERSSIRVFRSLQYIRNNAALARTEQSKSTSRDSRNSSTSTTYTTKSKLYRYDGLYKIVQMKPPIDPKGTFEFFMIRQGTHFSHTVPKEMGRDRFQFGRGNSDKRKSCSSPTSVPTVFSKSFESTAHQCGIDVPAGIPWKLSWAKDYGPQELSCCAIMLLLGKELSTIHTLASLFRSRCGKRRKIGSQNASCANTRASSTQKQHTPPSPPPHRYHHFCNHWTDLPLDVALVPRKAAAVTARIRTRTDHPPDLPPWPPNRLRKDGSRLCIRMYRPRKIRKTRFVSKHKIETKAKKMFRTPVSSMSMSMSMPTEDRKVTRSMKQRATRTTRSLTKRLDELRRDSQPSRFLHYRRNDTR